MATWHEDIDLASLGDSWRGHLCEKMAASKNPVIVTDTDAKHSIVACNAAWNTLCGYSPEEALGNSPKILQGRKTDHSKARQFTRAVCDMALYGDGIGFAARRSMSSTKLINYTKSGRPFIHCLRTTRIKDEDTGKEYFYTESHEEHDEKIQQAIYRRSGLGEKHEARDSAIYVIGLLALLWPALCPTALALIKLASSYFAAPAAEDTSVAATWGRYLTLFFPADLVDPEVSSSFA